MKIQNFNTQVYAVKGWPCIYSTLFARLLRQCTVCGGKGLNHPLTKNSAIVNDKYYILISDIVILIFWMSFKRTEQGLATSFTVHRHATATTNPWVDQCAVCSALKLDTFTLVTVILNVSLDFEKQKFLWKLINRLQKFSISSSKYN